MMDVERSIVVQRKPAEVFAFVSDLANEPRFHTDVREARRVSGGGIGVGTVFELSPASRTAPRVATARVTRYVPDEEIEFESQYGSMRPLRTYRVAPEGDGTRVSHRLRLEMKGPMALMSFPMKRMVAKRWDTFLANLKRVLEA